eukprot:gene7614-10367_t
MASLHYNNALLPEITRNDIESDNLQSDEEIQICLKEVEELFSKHLALYHDISELDKSLSKLIRLISAHFSLKYIFKVEVRKVILLLFLDLLYCKRLSYPTQIKLLTSTISLCDKDLPLIEGVTFSWKTFWDDCIDITRRTDRHLATISDHILLEYFGKLAEFLHHCRMYIDSNAADQIVSIAMKSLSDIRTPTCLEGILLLLNCLPTKYSGYDQWLPIWIETWSKISNNASWDCCWLTLFTRARKHSSSFDWSSISPSLYAKLNELLQLPVDGGGKSQQQQSNAEFPYGFPGYYTKLLVINAESRKIAINKISKLIYFLSTCSVGPYITAEAISVSPPMLSPERESSFANDGSSIQLPGYNTPGKEVHFAAVKFVSVLQIMRPYFYPSNNGAWTANLAYSLTTYIYQICRHVGRGVALTVLNNSETNKFNSPVHVQTIQYLFGSVLSLVFEGLFSKNQLMIQLCSSNIKNIVSIDPSFGEIVIPFLLSALDPSRVNQSHQAPVAMQTFSLCFKSLMFPSPTMLKYLPELLRLSLPGIDPSDMIKTTATLKLYSDILQWLPIQSKYNAPKSSDTSFPISLLYTAKSVDEAHSASQKKNKIVSLKKYQFELDLLAEYLPEWSNLLFDKLFTLLETQEQKIKGTRDSPIVSSISQVTGFFFQSVAGNDEIRTSIENKIIEYFVKSAPLNAAKGGAKVLDSMCTSNPALVAALLQRLIDQEVLSGFYSPEKLALRIRLAGGVCRSSQATELLPIIDKLIHPIYNNDSIFRNHAEKPVRKSVGKLVKDVLKGMVSFYPIHIKPVYDSNNPLAICSSTMEAPDKAMKWYVPTTSAIISAKKILEVTVNKSMDDIIAFLSTNIESNNTSSASDSSSSELSINKAQEMIINNLKLIGKSLRGAAEMLGDYDNLKSEVENPDVNYPILATGRDALLNQLSVEDKRYFIELRGNVLKFLHQLHDTLFNKIPSNSIYTSLKNNEPINKCWMKIMNLIVNRRMACLKDVDNTKKWLKYSKRMSRTSVIRIMYKATKNKNYDKTLPPSNDPWIQLYRSELYWRTLDLSTNHTACVGWLQHVIRCKELSFAACRKYVYNKGIDSSENENLYIACLHQLLSLGSHEYDVIRRNAIAFFDKISMRFGFKTMPIIKQLLNALSNPSTNYFDASRAASILIHPRVMKKVTNDIHLVNQLLSGVYGSEAIAYRVDETDKREKLMKKIAELFVKYVTSWHHKIRPDKGVNEIILINSLAVLGYNVSTTGNNTTEVNDVNKNTASAASGLRYETYAAYSILHLIGNPDFSNFTSSFVTELWKWSLQTISSAGGQPIHPISVAILARLAQNLNILVTNSKNDSLELLQSIQSLLLPNTESKNSKIWNALLHGISLSRPKSSEDGSKAQWSHGIGNILSATEYLRIVQPRSVSCIRTDRNIASPVFRKEYTSIFYSFALSEVLNVHSDEGSSVHLFNNPSLLQSIFDEISVIPSTSEGETRSNNATKAELWAGFLRAYFIQSNNSNNHFQKTEIEKIFLTILFENVEKISMEYCKDWAEGIFFAFSSISRNEILDEISSHILELFKLIIIGHNNNTNNSNNTENNNTLNEEGFARQGKILLLTRSLLIADISSYYCSENKSNSSIFGMKIISILEMEGQEIVSPYRTSRQELAGILSALCEFSTGNNIHNLLQKLKTKTIINSTNSNNDMIIVDNNDNNNFDGNENEQLTQESINKNSVRNAFELSYLWLRHLLHGLPFYKVESLIPDLFRIVLTGSGNAEIETAKSCHATCLQISFKLIGYSNTPILSDIIENVLFVNLNHNSWHVRETVMICAKIIMINNYIYFSEEIKKKVKDIFANGMNDVKPEVQLLARAGMIAYLMYKPIKELTIIAETYIKNSDTFATREKKRRKLLKDQNNASSIPAEKIDPVYLTTIMMSSCVIMVFPYDLPQFMPSLVTSLIRHISVPPLKDIVSRTLQLFKLTHQDRWEDFKLQFTREQLEDLQGAGAAHYYS